MTVFRARHTYALMALSAAMGFCLAMAITSVPEGQPVGAVVTEDDRRWDCLRMGNRTCRIDGVLVTSVDDMPPVEDAYGQCLYGLRIPERVEGVRFASELCEPVAKNLG